VVDNPIAGGIFIPAGNSDVTIANCHATKFARGIEASAANIIINDSYFNRNQGVGGLFFTPPGSSLTFLSSHFDQNESGPQDSQFGRGLEFQLDGTTTIISSTASGNFQTGLIAFDKTKVSIWDSEISHNGDFGRCCG
jgi:hypothetical protein